MRKQNGKIVRYKPGDIMEVEDIKELGGAVDKFEILDPVPEKDVTPLDEDKPATALKMVHRGGGRYNVVNTETDDAINDDYLTKEEAEVMAGISAPEKGGGRRRK